MPSRIITTPCPKEADTETIPGCNTLPGLSGEADIALRINTAALVVTVALRVNRSYVNATVFRADQRPNNISRE